MDRVAAARERLEAVKSLALQASEAGPPCSDCRYRTLLGMCSNPAYAEMRFDPAKGRLIEQFNVPVGEARSDVGVCGPEAILFEPQIIPVVVAKGAYSGVRTVILAIAGVILTIGLLMMLSGH